MNRYEFTEVISKCKSRFVKLQEVRGYTQSLCEFDGITASGNFKFNFEEGSTIEDAYYFLLSDEEFAAELKRLDSVNEEICNALIIIDRHFVLTGAQSSTLENLRGRYAK